MLKPPIPQEDFSAGMVRVAPHLLPKNAAWRLPNMLLDDDGSIYKRGGTVAETNAPFGAGLRFLWDGQLAGGHRTVFLSSTELGIIDEDGETPVGFGHGGSLRPLRPAVLDGILFVGEYAYAGSRLTAAPYAAGTVQVVGPTDVAPGSTTVVGTGTAWMANIDPGTILKIGDALVAVASVSDDEHLELVNPWGGASGAGLGYIAEAVPELPDAYHPNGVYGAVSGRLLSAEGNRVYMSQGGDSSIHDQTEYHQMPSGELVLAIEGLRDLAYIFTTGGIWVITNTPYDLTDDFGDSQQQLQRVSGDIVLWDGPGLTFWGETLVVPALDGVWLIGPGAPPEMLTRSIAPLYTEYVRQGYHVGQAAVYHGHFFLPVLDGAYDVVTLLVCRIDRPVEIRGLGIVFGWTDWSGSGGHVAALATRTIGAPVLLGAGRDATALVLRMPTFAPDGEPLDHDGTAMTWGVVSRDYATGPLNINFLKKVRLRYELIALEAVATLQGSYGTDARPASATWGLAVWGVDPWADTADVGFTTLPDLAPESEGDLPFTWRINKRTRYLRFRALSSEPCSRGVIRSIELFVRPSGRM